MELIQQLINGVALAGVYGLIAIGFSLVYGVLRVVNFAHGDIYMAGTFTAFWLITYEHWNFMAGASVGIISGAVVAVVVERVGSRPVRDQPRMIAMISTYALGLVIRNLVAVKQGDASANFSTPLSGKTVAVGALRLPLVALVAIAVAVATVVLLTLFLRKTRSGFAIRATAQDFATASLMGIPTTRVVVMVFAIGGAIGVIGGLVYSSMFGIFYVGMGFDGLLKGFAAAVVGGIGDLRGALVGGLVIGIAEGAIAPYLSSAYSDAISYGLLILVLIVRPVGLFGKQVEVRV